jgi:hypothetical protein
MTPISKSLERLIEAIYEDGEVSTVEFRTLRDTADYRWESIRGRLGDNNTLISFQSTMDVAMHLLYLSVQHIQARELSDEDEAAVKDAIMAQVEYLRCGAMLGLRALQSGQNTL